jgi:hypothetical protein
MTDEISQPSTESAPSGPQEVVVVEQPRPSLEETLAKVGNDIFSRNEPERDAGGRFQPKVVAPPESGAPEGVEVPGSPVAAPPELAPAPTIEAPQSLPASLREKWSTLPPDVQRDIAARESEAHQRITTDGQRIKSLQQYEELAAPLAEAARALNLSVPDYQRGLMDGDRFIKQHPDQAILRIAQAYGVDLNALVTGAPQPQRQPNPNSDLYRELNAVKSELTSIKEQTQSEKLKAAEQTVASFKKDKPYFDEVEPLMTKLYEPGMDLNALYDMAVNASPEVRARVAAEKAAAEAKERQAKDAKVAPFARRPGTAPTAPVKAGSWQETFDNKARELRSR